MAYRLFVFQPTVAFIGTKPTNIYIAERHRFIKIANGKQISPDLHLFFRLSILTSSSSSCSSSSRRLQAGRLRLAVFKLVVFASPSSSWSSLPRRLQAGRLCLAVFKLVVFASPFSSDLLHLIAFAAWSWISSVFASSPSSWTFTDWRRCSAPRIPASPTQPTEEKLSPI
ncbi:hypothetical protein OUZ56_006949 [Daphnia magna]|uniref:Uncharacterized protein n=1 Tax=Daphnia magna TaxID=35525 RepID=A0ABQ9YX52_9CRUS|nr:hypothetical protein OUZ56_006949 [Daphnia magna]